MSPDDDTDNDNDNSDDDSAITLYEHKFFVVI